eukprot:m.215806 g.215806  ORF g.215806 m.215806 type:complete len:713 (+) comp33193_c0_seq1:212-2350(+)
MSGFKMVLPRLARSFGFASAQGTVQVVPINTFRTTTTLTRMIRSQHDGKGGHATQTNTSTNASTNATANTNTAADTSATSTSISNTHTEEVGDTDKNATRLSDASSLFRAIAKVSSVFVGKNTLSIDATHSSSPSNPHTPSANTTKITTRATATPPPPTKATPPTPTSVPLPTPIPTIPTTSPTTHHTNPNVAHSTSEVEEMSVSSNDRLEHRSTPNNTTTTNTPHLTAPSTATPPSSSSSPSSPSPPPSPSSSSASQPDTSKQRKQLSSRSQEVAVPASRFARAMQFGSLAAGLGANMLGRYSKRTLGLNTAGDDGSMFSDASADMIVNTLCRVRGAALKLGQMISIQDEGVLPPQLAKIFDRVREGADFMPTHQLEQQMESQLGADWKAKFAEFEMRPFAAASIGQVHRAVLHDNREVAVKVQYPGVAESIDSDISNLMMVLNGTGLLPKGLYIDNVLAETKIELRQECDYVREATCCVKFKELLQDVPNVQVLTVVPELSTERVLTTEMLYGVTLEKLQEADQETRDLVSKTVFHVSLLEIFIFRMMQTDPNWGNYLYNPETRQLQLLDFGATIEYSKEFVAGYIEIFHAASIGDHQKCLSESIKLGFLSGYEDEEMHRAHVKAVMSLGRPLALDTTFDFGSQDVTQDVRAQIPIMLKHREKAPPSETYSLHRKLSGTFLICTRLRANIECRSLFTKIYETYHLETLLK